jgi:hypothetical protein
MDANTKTNTYGTSEIRGLTAHELDAVNGGASLCSQVEKRVDDARNELRKTWSA